jgi:TRAP-type C4-dicarboxylate transport system permease small subunit
MFKKVSKPLLIALAIVAGVILVAAIIFGILYSIEWHSKNFNQTQKCMYC